MGQYTESQYDDDLTVGVDEYDDFVQTDNVDLFEFYGEEESIISKLKTIILSIDWEITNENLSEFNSELLVLKESLVGDNINLVYAQALEKICKYIYKEKSNSNHNAIKLLQSFFYTLEKNLTSDSVTEEEKKTTLVKDVKQFERLKSQIGGKGKPKSPPTPSAPQELAPTLSVESTDENSPLLKLKALILGMDWEITEEELTKLGQEVKVLEKYYKSSRPKLIFLQGIGVLGAYIKNKKSDSHPDVFKLLHSFSENLDKIVSNLYTYDQEKAILLPEVEKFNKFKEMVADTVGGQAKDNNERHEEEQYENIAPAFADMDEESSGFQEEEEVAAMAKADPSLSIDNKVDSFFGGLEPATSDTGQESISDGEGSVSISNAFDDDLTTNEESNVDIALRGVDVETEADDDSDEEPLPFSANGELAPALGGNDLAGYTEEENTGSWESSDETNEIFDKLDGFFDEAEDATIREENVQAALQGVDVETEADDESEEEPLPLSDAGEFAPAFSDIEDDSFSSDTDSKEPEVIAAADTVDVSKTLDNFFGEDDTDIVPPPVGLDKSEESEQGAIEPALTDFDTDESSDSDDFFGDDSDNQFSFAEDVEEDAEDQLFKQEDLSPALLDEDIVNESDFSSGVEDTLDSFFAEEKEQEAGVEKAQESEVVAEEVVDTSTEETGVFAEDEEPALVQEFALDGDGVIEDIFETQIDEDTLGLVAASTNASDTVLEDDDELFTTEDDKPALAQEFGLDDDIVSEDIFEVQIEEDDEGLFSATTDESQTDIEDIDESITAEDEEEVIFEVVGDDDSEQIVPNEDILEDGGFSAIFEEVVEEESVSVEDSVELSENNELTCAVDEQKDESIEEDVISSFADATEVSLNDDEQEEDLEEYFKNTGLADTELDDLANLRVGVSSIGVELEDGILDSLAAEIRELSQKWEGRLVGKTLLQLMSTILQHINHYRYEASSDSHDMLLSIFDKVEVVSRGDLETVEEQQILLTETSKVLQWQQIMLDRQAVKKGDTLTFMDPIRADGSIDQKVGEFVFTEDDIVAEEEDNIFAKDPLIENQEVSEKTITQVSLEEENDFSSDSTSTPNNEEITNVIREEMNILRESLQAEIESLRKDFGKD